MLQWRLAISFLAFGLAACDAGGAASTRAPGAAASVEAQAIQWPAAIEQATRAHLSPAARVAVARAPVPVLVPRAAPIASRAKIVSEAAFYALSTSDDAGVTIALHASRVAYHQPDLAPMAGNATLRGVRGFVSVNEGIRTASWVENGVAYALDVECADPSDARCADEAYVVALAGSLAYVGGDGR
jgi:hypothetical protein